MAWEPRATRAVRHFLRHSSVSGVSSTADPVLVHRSAGSLHRRATHLWTTGSEEQAQDAAASKAAATSSRRRSAPNGATICTPTGRPSRVVPAGTEIAGQPVTVMT
jgi:hypothetical protein